MKPKYSISLMVATFFYSGYFPFAPGTFASIIALIIWVILPFESTIVHVCLILIVLLAGVLTSDIIEKKVQHKDPSFIVIDEVLGMWITLLTLPKTFIAYILGLIVFRIFDILKPPPIRNLESIEGGLGIIADDVIAGFLAAISVQIILMIIT